MLFMKSQTIQDIRFTKQKQTLFMFYLLLILTMIHVANVKFLRSKTQTGSVEEVDQILNEGSETEVPCTEIYISEGDQPSASYKLSKSTKGKFSASFVEHLENIRIDLSLPGSKDLLVYQFYHTQKSETEKLRKPISLSNYFAQNESNPELRNLIEAEHTLVSTLIGFGYGIDSSYFLPEPVYENNKLKKIIYFLYDLNRLNEKAKAELLQFHQ